MVLHQTAFPALYNNACSNSCIYINVCHQHNYQRGLEETIQHNLVFLKSSCILIFYIWLKQSVLRKGENAKDRVKGQETEGGRKGRVSGGGCAVVRPGVCEEENVAVLMAVSSGSRCV